MSIEAVRRVWARTRHSGGALTLMLAIADCVNSEKDLAWPSISTLATMTRLTERQVHKLVKLLVQSDEIKIERGGGRGRSNRYRIMLPPVNPELQFTESEFTENNSLNSKTVNPELFVTKPCPTVHPIHKEPLKPLSKAASKAEIWFKEVFLPAYPEHRQDTSYTTATNWIRNHRKELGDEQTRVAIMENLAAWKLSPEWTKDGGEYVPGIGKYFKEGKYKRRPVTGKGILKTALPPTAAEYYDIDAGGAAK